MEEKGFVSLEWNEQKSSFLNTLSYVRNNEKFSDTTIACDGKFYMAHKLLLSASSDYFDQMFAETECKNTVIVLKDISSSDFELLRSYMYLGEVKVELVHSSNLIKAARCLRIKGLAVLYEKPSLQSWAGRDGSFGSLDAMRRRTVGRPAGHINSFSSVENSNAVLSDSTKRKQVSGGEISVNKTGIDDSSLSYISRETCIVQIADEECSHERNSSVKSEKVNSPYGIYLVPDGEEPVKQEPVTVYFDNTTTNFSSFVPENFRKEPLFMDALPHSDDGSKLSGLELAEAAREGVGAYTYIKILRKTCRNVTTSNQIDER